MLDADCFPPAQLYIVTAISATIMAKLEDMGKKTRWIVVVGFLACCGHLLYVLYDVQSTDISRELFWNLKVHMTASFILYASFLVWLAKKRPPKLVKGD